MPTIATQNVIHTQVYHSLCGDLLLGSLGEQLCLCDWTNRRNATSVLFRLKRHLRAHFIEDGSATTDMAIRQLDEYFCGMRHMFSIHLLFAGTSFQHAVWSALLSVPCGETITYLQLAERIGCRQSVRAVANAVGANAVSIFVPCHRIVGTDGSLTGYAGGLSAKHFLLQLESPLSVMSHVR